MYSLFAAHDTGSAQGAPTFQVASVRENRSGGMTFWGADLDRVMYERNVLPRPIVTAIREQLGLRLEPGAHPMEMLVIDSVEMPAAN